MDRAILERHLAEAEEHVADGVGHIEGQRQLISKLQRDGRDTALAKTLLAEFEQTQARHIAHRDRIKQRLAELAADRQRHD